MESEQQYYQLRSGSRSRSGTPSMHNYATSKPETVVEHRYDLRSQSRERSRTPGEVAVTVSSRSVVRPTDSKIHDQNLELTVERKKEQLSQNQTKTKKPECSTSRNVERRSERQKAKRQMLANGQSETTDVTLDRENNVKQENLYYHKTVTSDYSSEEGEDRDLPSGPSLAYQIYKQAGEWWNVFPKTDYTYSKTSECRYEIAPGVLAMPNMSRRSIHSNDSSVSSTSMPSVSQQNVSQESGFAESLDVDFISKQTDAQIRTHTDDYHRNSKMQYVKKHVEQYRSHREVIHTVPGNLRQRRSLFDSRKSSIGTEFDQTAFVPLSKNYQQRWKMTRWFSSFTTVVVHWFSKAVEFLELKTVKKRERENWTSYPYQSHQESRLYRTSRYIDHSFNYVYLLMVKIFFFDSWLLSRVSNIRRRVQERRFRILWISLLPLLLLTGSWCLPYLSASLPYNEIIIRRETREPKFFVEKRVNLMNDQPTEKEDFKSIAATLGSRLDKLEDQSLKQTEHLSSINRVLGDLKNKMIGLEKSLYENQRTDVNSLEIQAIRLEFDALKELYSELKLCCNTGKELFTNEHVEKRVEKVLSEYFGGALSRKDLTAVIRNLMAKEESTAHGDGGSSNVTEHRVHEIVKEALKIYDADKTGRVDYALESAGGQIISTRCTQRYDIKTRVFMLLNLPLYHENHTPRTVIQGNPIQPGVCWAFQGFPGYLLIKLRSMIYVTGFTVEHAPKSILPNGEMRSAPHKFNVWGFTNENDPDPVMFGDYEFLASDESLQYFSVQNATIAAPYEYIELRVHSNHGQLEYTCLYRFRVHGKPV